MNAMRRGAPAIQNVQHRIGLARLGIAFRQGNEEFVPLASSQKSRGTQPHHRVEVRQYAPDCLRIVTGTRVLAVIGVDTFQDMDRTTDPDEIREIAEPPRWLPGPRSLSPLSPRPLKEFDAGPQFSGNGKAGLVSAQRTLG